MLELQWVRSNHANAQHEPSAFRLERALIVTKLSRYEFEQLRHPHLSAGQLEEMLRNRGTDFESIIHRHNVNKNFERMIVRSFRDVGCDVKLTNRQVKTSPSL